MKFIHDKHRRGNARTFGKKDAEERAAIHGKLAGKLARAGTSTAHQIAADAAWTAWHYAEIAAEEGGR